MKRAKVFRRADNWRAEGSGGGCEDRRPGPPARGHVTAYKDGKLYLMQFGEDSELRMVELLPMLTEVKEAEAELEKSERKSRSADYK